MLGLSWDRTKVAALERGDKAISAEELMLLPVVLADAGAPIRGMAELFGDGVVDVRISYAFGALQAHEVAELLTGKVYAVVGKSRHPSGRAVTKDGLGRGIGALIPDPKSGMRLPPISPNELGAAIDRLVEMGFRADPDALRQAAVSAGEAEEKAARKLGEAKLVVAGVAFALWGRSLTEERDRLVGMEIERSQWDPDFTPRRVQAIRGHQTRRLLAEMSERIDAAKRGKVPKHALSARAPRYWEAAYAGKHPNQFYIIRPVGEVSSDPMKLAARIDQLCGDEAKLIIRRWWGGVRGVDPFQFEKLLAIITGRMLASLPVDESLLDPAQFRQVRDGYMEKDIAAVLLGIKEMLKAAGLLSADEVTE